MNPYLQEILHDITTRLAKLEDIEPTVNGWPLWSGLPQPNKEWVGLTDDEIIDAANMAPFETMVSAEDYIYIIARAIEAKLKEKNT
jgi:hypothetical protein